MSIVLSPARRWWECLQRSEPVPLRRPGAGWLVPVLALSQLGLTLSAVRFSGHAAWNTVEIWMLILSAVGALTVQHIVLRRREARTVGATADWMPLVVEQALGPFIMINSSGRVMEWNGAAERLFGWSRDEVSGRPLAEVLMPPEQRASLRREFERVGPTGRIRIDARDRHGIVIPVEVRMSLLRSGGASVSVLFLSHITERKQLEAHLHALQKLEAVGHLAGGAAHDLNNMLLVIGAYGELLKDDTSLRGSQREWVRQIGQATTRATELTGRLLAFSRREALPSRAVTLNDLIASLEPMLRPLLGERIEFMSVLDPALGCLRADPRQIERALINVCLNARDAMPQGGRLIIMTERVCLDEAAIRPHGLDEPGFYVRLIVRDTGIGMDAETLSHAFERFFTTKPKGRGTGLGLPSVSDIVAESRGAITISSEPGRGTSVAMYLPLISPPASVEDVHQSPDGAAAGTEADTGAVVRETSPPRESLCGDVRNKVIAYWNRLLAGKQ